MLSLQPGGAVIPATAVVYGQLVESPILAAQSPDLNVQPSAPQTLSPLLAKLPLPLPGSSRDKSVSGHGVGAGRASVGGQLHAAHVDPLYPDHLRPLCELFEVFSFDFAKPPRQNHTQQLQASLCNAYF